MENYTHPGHRNIGFIGMLNLAGFVFYPTDKPTEMNKIIYLEINEVLQAAVVKEIAHPRHSLFHVLFENGYENIFFTDVETGNWIEEDLGFTQLADTFGKSVDHQLSATTLVPRPLIWQKVDGLTVFGFYNYNYQENEIYEIYFPNRKFMCYLLRTVKNDWYLLKTHSIFKCREVDIEALEIITGILEEY